MKQISPQSACRLSDQISDTEGSRSFRTDHGLVGGIMASTFETHVGENESWAFPYGENIQSIIEQYTPLPGGRAVVKAKLMLAQVKVFEVQAVPEGMNQDAELLYQSRLPSDVQSLVSFDLYRASSQPAEHLLEAWGKSPLRPTNQDAMTLAEVKRTAYLRFHRNQQSQAITFVPPENSKKFALAALTVDARGEDCSLINARDKAQLEDIARKGGRVALWLGFMSHPDGLGGTLIICGDQTMYQAEEGLPNAPCATIVSSVEPQMVTRRLPSLMGLGETLDGAYKAYATSVEERDK